MSRSSSEKKRWASVPAPSEHRARPEIAVSEPVEVVSLEKEQLVSEN
jgi:hypothetical protein